MDKVGTWKIRLVVGVVGMFVVSTFFAFRELQYLVWGRTTSAELIEVYEGTGGGGRSSGPALVVHYAFADQDGGLAMRDENAFLPIDSPRPAGNAVQVQYLPGTKYASRLAGQQRTQDVVFFAVSLLLMGGFIAKLALEANEPVKKPRSSQRSR